MHIPSLPIGRSTVKWMEWYLDVRNEDGVLTKQNDKYFWQSGSQQQHDRVVHAVSRSRDKKGVFMQGDLYTFAGGKLYRSGNIYLEKNPIEAFIVGPLGSTAFPLGIRGVKVAVPTDRGMDEYFENVEKTGFSILDITEDNIQVRMYKYLSERDEPSMISELTPFKTITI